MAGPTYQRRVATATLLLCFVLGTMLLALDIDPQPGEHSERGDGQQETVEPVDGAPAATSGQTHQIASVQQWDAAVANAQPGDVLRLTQTINSRLVYRGQHSANPGSGADGRADAPIVITANPGVWVDPGNINSGFGAIDVVSAFHVHVDSVSVRNAQFGIRCMQCTGTAGSPIRISNNVVTDIGHAGIYVGGHWQTHSPSSQVLVEANQVTRTGRSAPRYGEGIYLGYGGTEWVDTSSDIVVRNNNISLTGAEGVDVKPGTRNVHVIGNMIHDLAPIDGGAISAHYVNLVPNPHPGQLDYVRVEANRIWNLNLGGTSGSNDWAIWVGHGGVDIVDNMIWGLRSDPGKARAVRVRATQSFGPHPINIVGNTFWTARGWVAEGQPSGAANVVAIGNHGLDPSSSEIQIDASLIAGPAPAPGSGGTADAGGGPGSGLVLITETAQLPALSPTPTPAPAPTPSTTASPPVPKSTPTVGGLPESVPSTPATSGAIDPSRLGDVGQASGNEIGNPSPQRPSAAESAAADPRQVPTPGSSPVALGEDAGAGIAGEGRRRVDADAASTAASTLEPNLGSNGAGPVDGLQLDQLVESDLELAFVLDTLAAVQSAPDTGLAFSGPGAPVGVEAGLSNPVGADAAGRTNPTGSGTLSSGALAFVEEQLSLREATITSNGGPSISAGPFDIVVPGSHRIPARRMGVGLFVLLLGACVGLGLAAADFRAPRRPLSPSAP